MKVIEEYYNREFQGFDWLNFEHLRESKGFRFEVYLNQSGDLVSQSISCFYYLFGNQQPEILIHPFRPDSEWGNFCLDVWDIEKDSYDYSPENKEEPTASYLLMLRESGIRPDYSGFCKCLDWDKFLHIILHCIMQHTAPYSLMFYVPNRNFVFYFHHSGSLGIYYKELNTDIVSIVRKAKEENLEIKNFNDDRLQSLS